MTDYAPAATSEQSWTWWMTTAAAAAMRMQNLREHHIGGGTDDEYAGPNRKRKRIGHDEYWTASGFDDDNGGGFQPSNDPTAAGPLDLSVKATLTATTRMMDERGTGGRGHSVVDEYKISTPVKKSTAVTGANGKSSKKTGGKTAGGTTAAATAVKAATRKLLPQLLLDHRRVDRSSPVSGTIIVPAMPDDPITGKQSSPLSLTEITSKDCGANGDQDDDYEGGDIDPEFNVVVATDEARRRLESIPNALGPYLCRLCGVQYTDAFALARHRCRCIVHVRYRCPECDKVFQCPANLASHRRWHGAGTTTGKSSGGGGNSRTKNGGVAIKLETIEAQQRDGLAATIESNNNNNNNVNENVSGVGNGILVKLEARETRQHNAAAEVKDNVNGGVTIKLEAREAHQNGVVENDVDEDDRCVVTSGRSDSVATAEIFVAPAVTTTTTAGFKKNMLQRAVQAAAAAANNNNNDDDDDNYDHAAAKDTT